MDKPRTFDYHAYDDIYPLEIQISTYANNALAIIANTWNNGYPEPWGPLTVNLDLPNTLAKDYAFIDVNNNPNIIKFLEENNFGHKTGITMQSGFVNYPEFKFNNKLLKELDPTGYKIYENNYH